MAWTNPSTRSTGDLITAAIWNQDIVTNTQALYDNLEVGSITDGGFYVSNSASLQTIVDWNIPANTLGANGFVSGYATVIVQNNTGSADTLELRMLLVDETPTTDTCGPIQTSVPGSSNFWYMFQIFAFMINDNGTATQRFGFSVLNYGIDGTLTQANGATSGSEAQGGVISSIVESGGRDTATDIVTVRLRAQLGSASANLNMMGGGYIYHGFVS